MLTITEALTAVSQKLEQMSPPDDSFVVVEKHTIEKPFGWVFFYNSKRFLETQEFRYRLAGNGPVIVDKYRGSVQFFGAGKPLEEILAEYEKKLADGRRP